MFSDVDHGLTVSIWSGLLPSDDRASEEGGSRAHKERPIMGLRRQWGHRHNMRCHA